jgi:hypothetical protein
MGKVDIEMTSEDITFSWIEGNFHSVAAMPFANFCRYVRDDTIELSLEGPRDSLGRGCFTDMNKGRLEAFSDGVIAVINSIMVLK